jgi:hypothetical protein
MGRWTFITAGVVGAAFLLGLVALSRSDPTPIVGVPPAPPWGAPAVGEGLAGASRDTFRLIRAIEKHYVRRMNLPDRELSSSMRFGFFESEADMKSIHVARFDTVPRAGAYYRPSEKKIFLAKRRGRNTYSRRSFVHETVHFLNDVYLAPGRERMPRWLNEGLALWMETDFEEGASERWLKRMRFRRRLMLQYCAFRVGFVPLGELLNASRWPDRWVVPRTTMAYYNSSLALVLHLRNKTGPAFPAAVLAYMAARRKAGTTATGAFEQAFPMDTNSGYAEILRGLRDSFWARRTRGAAWAQDGGEGECDGLVAGEAGS